jgi:hypothetical protein
MNAILEGAWDYTAPPGHVTFSVLGEEAGGHSVSIASKNYTGVVRATKSALSNMNAGAVFEGAIEIIRRSIVCHGDDCPREDDELLGAFISALLKHPDRRTRKTLAAGISSRLKREGEAHVILFIPPVGPSAWILGAPGGTGRMP